MKNITRKLKNMGTTIGLGLLGIAAGLSMNGCTMNPSEFQSYVLGIGPTERERAIAVQEGIRVRTKDGYEINLYRGAEVYYYGQKASVINISPPKIELMPAPHKWNPRNIQSGTWVEIKELDMFRN
jgi:hypothetical protein